MDLHSTRARRKKAGVCVRCEAEADGTLCDVHRAAANEYAKARYARMKAAGKCPRCGNRLRPDGRCGVCNYAKRVRRRGTALQSVIDGSCVRD